ncbi:hypothetical protein J1614_008612 [Plenodomus biglobosus]|nr:hypothetical protein J1614_008612 [Plenodomus biglobosus]
MAFTTVLLCFVGEDGASRILMEFLPEHLLHYEQDGLRLAKDGPLLSAIRAYTTSIAKEESNSQIVEVILRKIDQDRGLIDEGCLYSGQQIDDRLVIGVLEWLAVPNTRREGPDVYFTRSVIVWSVTCALSALGFNVDASPEPIRSKFQYNAVLAQSSPGSKVCFVGSSVGETDGNVRPVPNRAVIPHYRYIPLRHIPTIEMQNHRFDNDGVCKKVCEIWVKTYQWVQDYLRSQTHIAEMIGERPHSTGSAANNILEGRDLSPYQKEGITQLSRTWCQSNPDELQAFLYRSIRAFIDKECSECASGRGHYAGLGDNCWLENLDGGDPPGTQEHNKIEKLYVKAILLSTAYSIASLFIRNGDSAMGLDTSVVFYPSNASDFRNCLSLHDKDWCPLMFRIAAVGDAKAWTNSLQGRPELLGSVFGAVCGFKQYVTPYTFGCYSNGLTLVSSLLLNPVSIRDYHVISMQFGQCLDLPLDENNLISSVEAESNLKRCCKFSLSDAYVDMTPQDLGSDLTRWDLEPDWMNSESKLHFQYRVRGVTKFSLSPSQMLKFLDNHSVWRIECMTPYEHQQLSCKSLESALSEPDGVEIIHVPFQRIRQAGFTNVRLVKPTTWRRGGKRRAILMQTKAESAEQWLALSTEFPLSPRCVEPAVRRILSSCAACALEEIQLEKVEGPTMFLVVVPEADSELDPEGPPEVVPEVDFEVEEM